MTRKSLLLAAMGLSAALLASEVAASGFQLREQSGTGQGTSYAGMSAGGEDISAMFFNPAALGRYRGNNVLGVASYIAPQSQFNNGASTRSTGATISGASSHRDSGKNAVVPAFYAMWDPGGAFKFGVSANVPFGLETEYDSDWMGRYHATRSAIRTLAIAPTMSYEATPGLTLGAAIVLQQIDAKLGKAVNVSQIGGGAFGNGDAFSDLEGTDGHGVGGRFGVLWEAAASTRVGAAFHTEIRHELKGDARFSGNTHPTLVNNNTLRDSAITANVALPETASFGVQQDLTPWLTLAGEASWTRWSKVQELRIRFATGRADDVTPLKWKDTYFLSLGAIARPAAGWTLRTGLAFDKSPVPDAERTPRIPDQDRTWLSLGASYQWNGALEFDAGYSHIFVRRARLQLVDTGGSGDANRFRGNLNGNYDTSIDILAVQARFKF